MALDDLISNIMSEEKSEELLHKWDSILPLIDRSLMSVKEIKPNVADMYKFDFNGLLMSLNIPEDYWYIHIRLNDFNSSTDYTGTTNIALINADYLETLYNAFTNNS